MTISPRQDWEAALHLYQDRIAAGRYSSREFEAELEGGASLTAPPTWCACTCPSCGKILTHLKEQAHDHEKVSGVE